MVLTIWLQVYTYIYTHMEIHTLSSLLMLCMAATSEYMPACSSSSKLKSTGTAEAEGASKAIGQKLLQGFHHSMGSDWASGVASCQR